MSARLAWRAACACLIALILLAVAWELFLAPLKPQGSWLVLKALPLMAPLFGVLHARRYTFQWSTLMIWIYAAEGATRIYTDKGLSAGEKRMLTRARQILVSELTFALNVDEQAAEEKLASVLP